MAHTGFEPVISALRGRCPSPLDECANDNRDFITLSLVHKTNCSIIYEVKTLPSGVVVALVTLDHATLVRIQARQPITSTPLAHPPRQMHRCATAPVPHSNSQLRRPHENRIHRHWPHRQPHGSPRPGGGSPTDGSRPGPAIYHQPGGNGSRLGAHPPSRGRGKRDNIHVSSRPSRG